MSIPGPIRAVWRAWTKVVMAVLDVVTFVLLVVVYFVCVAPLRLFGIGFDPHPGRWSKVEGQALTLEEARRHF